MSGPGTAVVIVGGGVAGARTCAELRKQGHTGTLTLLCQEHSLPYDRPPLSKAVLSGKRESKPLRVDYAALGVDLRLGWEAQSLDLNAGVVASATEAVPFEALVVATGSHPIRLPGGGEQHLLRTEADALRLRERLLPGARVVIIGASWIGAEVASTAMTLGARVICVEMGPAPVAQALGEHLGARFLPWWQDIDLRLNQGVTSIEADGVVLSSGEVLAADVVVTGIGVRPGTQWLAGSWLDPAGRAVPTDAFLRTQDPRVLALGDAASWWSLRFGAQLEIQHWDDASAAAAVVASSIVGGDASDVVHDPVPYFWSDQFGHRIEYVGHHSATDAVVHREGPDGSWTTAWLDDRDRLTAVLAVDQSKEVAAGRRLIAAEATPSMAALADVPLVEQDTAASDR